MIILTICSIFFTKDLTFITIRIPIPIRKILLLTTKENKGDNTADHSVELFIHFYIQQLKSNHERSVYRIDALFSTSPRIDQ